MRVWRINTWDYSEPSHKGTFFSPEAAFTAFVAAIGSAGVFECSHLQTELHDAGENDPNGDIILSLGEFDAVTLTGENVAGGPEDERKDLADRHELLHVHARLSALLVKHGFAAYEYVLDRGDWGGTWKLSRV